MLCGLPPFPHLRRPSASASPLYFTVFPFLAAAAWAGGLSRSLLLAARRPVSCVAPSVQLRRGAPAWRLEGDRAPSGLWSPTAASLLAWPGAAADPEGVCRTRPPL